MTHLQGLYLPLKRFWLFKSSSIDLNAAIGKSGDRSSRRSQHQAQGCNHASASRIPSSNRTITRHFCIIEIDKIWTVTINSKDTKKWTQLQNSWVPRPPPQTAWGFSFFLFSCFLWQGGRDVLHRQQNLNKPFPISVVTKLENFWQPRAT